MQKKTKKNKDKKIKTDNTDFKAKRKKRLFETLGIIFITLAVLIAVALISNKNSGSFGRYVQVLYSLTFGYYVSYIIPAFLLIYGIMTFIQIKLLKKMKFSFIILLIGTILSTFYGLYNYSLIDKQLFDDKDYGPFVGFIGFKLSGILTTFFGTTGSYVFLSATLLILIMYTFDFHLSQMITFTLKPLQLGNRLIIHNIFNNIKKKKLKNKFNKEFKGYDADFELQQTPKEAIPDLEMVNNEKENLFPEDENKINFEKEQVLPTPTVQAPNPTAQNNSTPGNGNLQIGKQVIEAEVEFQQRSSKSIKYTPPSIELLNESKIKFNEQENEEILKENADLLEEKLEEFSVDAKVVKINPGPVITQYEIKLARGVKVAKISSLEKDLAMALKAKSIRIIAPIPGKDTVGIEIPNRKPSIVYLKTIINSAKFVKHKSKLAIALGKTISGENYTLDLKKTPHLLIAGSTGSGKSVCINGIITSILYRANPEEVQFCMIDPKKVELTIYSRLLKHHLLKVDGIDEAVVTNSDDAVRLLEALVEEMEIRYEVLKHSGTRNLDEYNELVESGELRFNEINGEEFKKFPYIVCIVDEYGDLMMTSGKAVEDPICRLAQMARAIGIHMILATQRPSVKVVTGLIKANFPTRIAFRVMSQIDSRTILDMKGAESLLGKGDMLLVPPGESELVRIQNALVETKETNRIVDHISSQPENFNKISISAAQAKEEVDFENSFTPGQASKVNKKDPLYDEARALVIQHQMASVSMLQRGLSIGYARAGKIIDNLAKDKIIGPHVGSKSREVLVQSSSN